MIFGVHGAVRCHELPFVHLEHVKEYTRDGQTLLYVTLPRTKNKKPRSFVNNNHERVKIVKKYLSLRPKKIVASRFFYRYTKGKPFNSFIGRNKFADMPRETALHLNLPNPELYTGNFIKCNKYLCYKYRLQ